MDLNNPIPQEWTSYVTQAAVGLEVVPSVLYDTVTYTSAVTTELVFFNAVRATADLGNLQQPGMLPNPQSFLIQSMSVYFKVVGTIAATVAASIANDLILLVNTGILRVKIGEKQYGPWPLWRLPAATFVKPAGSGIAVGPLINSYGQVDGPLYPLFPNLMLAPLQNFEARMQWPAGAVTLGAGNPPIELLWDGQLARGVQ